MRKITEQQELRLKGKPELEKAVKDILSQQMEQGTIEVPELWFHEFLVKEDCLPQPSFVQLMNELGRTTMKVVTVVVHSQVFDTDRNDLDRLLNTICYVFRIVDWKTGERKGTPNVEEQKEALNWLIGALAHWSKQSVLRKMFLVCILDINFN